MLCSNTTADDMALAAKKTNFITASSQNISWLWLILIFPFIFLTLELLKKTFSKPSQEKFCLTNVFEALFEMKDTFSLE